MTHILDNAPGPRGHFQLSVWRERPGLRDRQLLLQEVVQNIIVTGAKEQQARLIGGDVTNRSITTIGFGTSSAAAAVGNAALTGAFTKALSGVTYPSAGSVQFAFSLLASEATGMAIWEFGLLTAGGTLFARRVRAGAIQKDSDISLTGTWTITY